MVDDINASAVVPCSGCRSLPEVATDQAIEHNCAIRGPVKILFDKVFAKKESFWHEKAVHLSIDFEELV